MQTITEQLAQVHGGKAPAAPPSYGNNKVPNTDWSQMPSVESMMPKNASEIRDADARVQPQQEWKPPADLFSRMGM